MGRRSLLYSFDAVTSRFGFHKDMTEKTPRKKATKKKTSGKDKQPDPLSDDAPESVRAPWRAKKKEQFLEELMSNGGIVWPAAAAIDVTVKLLYKWRDADPEFSKAWHNAVERSTDVLEDEALRRGFKGYAGRPVVHQGEVVREMTEYSDTLLMAMLKSRRDKFRNKSEISGPGGAPISGVTEIKRTIVDPEESEE